MDHRDRGQIMLECGQLMRKVTDQRCSAIRTGPAGSDNAHSVNFVVVTTYYSAQDPIIQEGVQPDFDSPRYI